MIIEVEVKQKYGKPRFYPISSYAKLLTELMGKPTLTTEHLAKCRKAGFQISIKAPEYRVEDFITE